MITHERIVLLGISMLSILLAVVWCSMWLVQRERDLWLESSYRTCEIGLNRADAKLELVETYLTNIKNVREGRAIGGPAR